MPSVNTGINVKLLRMRKGWSQDRLADALSEYAPEIHRLERGDFVPSLDALDEVLDALEAHTDEFVYPSLEGQDMAVLTLRHNLLSALERRSLDEAIAVYNEMAAIEGFTDYPINHQFLLSQEARILEQQGEPVSKIMPLVIQGLNKTYPDLDDTSPGATVLLFEEPELFHTLARCYARLGDHPTAIRILKDTVHGLQRLSTGERIRDRHITPMVQSLAEYQSATGDYEGLPKTCELGIDLSSFRSAGRRVPQFLGYKATVLFKQGQAKEAVLQLKGAYALHMMMGDKDKANKALERAINEFGEGFETYGIEHLNIPAAVPRSFARGYIPSCKTIGEMTQILREDAGLVQQQLAQGICNRGTLSRIETADGRSMPSNIFHIEPLLQRLGRDPHLYCNFFLNRDDFEAIELRDMIHLLLNHGKHKRAAKALEKLKTYDAYSKGRKYTKANMQFVRRAEMSIFVSKHGYSHPEVEAKILEALRLTCPNFNEAKIAGYPLTIDEVLLINALAGYYENLASLDNLIRALDIYRALIQNIDHRYKDERDKVRIYITVMFRFSSCLGKLGLHDKSLEVTEKAIEICKSLGRLAPLTELTFNKAYAMCMLGYKKESLPYFVLAYYGFQAFKDYGRDRYISAAQQTIKEFFDITLD